MKKTSERERERESIIKLSQSTVIAITDLLSRVITGYETWIFEYDPETKRQSSQ